MIGLSVVDLKHHWHIEHDDDLNRLKGLRSPSGFESLFLHLYK
jgi:hypothetical protein